MNVIDELELMGRTAYADLQAGSFAHGRTRAELEMLVGARANTCCGIYAPEDDPPVPEEV